MATTRELRSLARHSMTGMCEVHSSRIMAAIDFLLFRAEEQRKGLPGKRGRGNLFCTKMGLNASPTN